MQKMGRRKKQIVTQFTVDMLFLVTGTIIGFVIMLALGLLAI